jgi:citrate lyase subunit gamma (acyl carrier protein)
VEILKEALAGTLESSDILVTVRPNPLEGIDIFLESNVMAMFGTQIADTARKVCAEMGVTRAVLELKDKGAIDCVIRARVAAALCRASETHYDWTKEDCHA